MLTLKKKDKYLAGVISDTHGLLRPEISRIFQDTDVILHAGDIDRPVVLDELQKIAPVVAVRGNMDSGIWANKLSSTEVVEIGSVMIYMLHNIYSLDLDPKAAGFSAVISGHTHCSAIKEDNGILFLNPGSAGPRRYHPASVALLHIQGTSLKVRIIELED